MLKPVSAPFCSTTTGGSTRVATAISRGAGWANAVVFSVTATHKAAASRPRTVNMGDTIDVWSAVFGV
jgi:hypothetical protein